MIKSALPSASSQLGDPRAFCDLLSMNLSSKHLSWLQIGYPAYLSIERNAHTNIHTRVYLQV